VGWEIGSKKPGDTLAGRDVHLVQRELDSLAGVALMRAELQKLHDGPQPEAMLNVEVHEIGDVVAEVLEFGGVVRDLARGLRRVWCWIEAIAGPGDIARVIVGWLWCAG
jgi:hypothetical protein